MDFYFMNFYNTAFGPQNEAMACERCNAKFNFFTRKKQCTDCLRYFCSECVIKRPDKTLNCDSCIMLSRRPLVRSQILQMRSKDLRQYLVAKKVSIKGCIEKEDLIEQMMVFANGTSNYTNINIAEDTSAQNISTASSQMTDIINERTDEHTNEHTDEHSNQEHGTNSARNNRVETGEISESTFVPDEGSEPIISERGETSDISSTHRSDTFKNIPVWSNNVKLSDINSLAELEYLTVKQLKNLLSINCVDYKGCVERCELLDKASRLWQKYNQSKTEMETLDEDLCKICWVEPIECVILECGHIACCLNCGKQMSECPICKQYIVRLVRFFKA
ncbi:E3 ubiquitin-protein ligase RNF34 isoform X2 [Ptiloglossa arizonensis]|uniref:E3 ubiquitin-protein ligase RNF34 isoform X2 n=1 Tax=Ptiloglossa arizonensis TaxID=3350558 RepID=UPI003FA15435